MTHLPHHFSWWVRRRLRVSRWDVSVERVHLLRHLIKWRKAPGTEFPIPGYSEPPKNARGKNYPPGWSLSNFHALNRAHAKLRRAGYSH